PWRALHALGAELAAGGDLGKIRVAAEQNPGLVAPVLREDRLQMPDDRPLDSYVGLAPVPDMAAVTGPLGADPRPAREAEAIVDRDLRRDVVRRMRASRQRDREQRERDPNQ